jgi:hypothetical protein
MDWPSVIHLDRKQIPATLYVLGAKAQAARQKLRQQDMTFSYAQPFTFRLRPAPARLAPAIKIAAVRQGVTQIILSDGRLVRASLQVKGINQNRQKPGSLDISYSVVTEIINEPVVPDHAAHETLQ